MNYLAQLGGHVSTLANQLQNAYLARDEMRVTEELLHLTCFYCLHMAQPFIINNILRFRRKLFLHLRL